MPPVLPTTGGSSQGGPSLSARSWCTGVPPRRAVPGPGAPPRGRPSSGPALSLISATSRRPTPSPTPVSSQRLTACLGPVASPGQGARRLRASPRRPSARRLAPWPPRSPPPWPRGPAARGSACGEAVPRPPSWARGAAAGPAQALGCPLLLLPPAAPGQGSAHPPPPAASASAPAGSWRRPGRPRCHLRGPAVVTRAPPPPLHLAV